MFNPTSKKETTTVHIVIYRLPTVESTIERTEE